MKTNALQLDKKRTFTDRRLIRVSTACGIIATAACVIVFVAHGADSRAAAVSFSILIYPVAALIISGLWLASAELLRIYLSTVGCRCSGASFICPET